jgi:type IV secretory pathway TrbD component
MNVEKFTSPVAYASSGALVIFGIPANDIAMAIGVLCTVFTAGINWWYKRKDSLAKESPVELKE